MDFKKIPIGYFIVYKTENDWLQTQIVNYQIKSGFSNQDSQFVHVEPSIGNGYSIRASLPFIKPINILDEQQGRYIKIVAPKFKGKEDLVIDFDSFEGRYKTALWSASRSNLVYGLLGLLWFPLKRFIRMKNVFSFAGDFCSELCGFGLYREYCPHLPAKYDDIESNILPKHYNQLMPADFLNKDFFEIAYEGFIPKKENLNG